MPVLHIAPGDSAGGSLLQGLRKAGRSDEVLRFPDDLSCGPIATDDAVVRDDWWNGFYDHSDRRGRIETFWRRVMDADNKFVVWLGRGSARELAFFLAWTERMGDHVYDVVDVAAVSRSGSVWPTFPAGVVSVLQPDQLMAALPLARPLELSERRAAQEHWRALKAINAPFRVIRDGQLVSVDERIFDRVILNASSNDWQLVRRIVGETMGALWDPYAQVGDIMLWARVTALVAEGKLLADRDSNDFEARVKLPV